MHQEAYVLDGEPLRSGSANFSYPGEKHQDNDLILILIRTPSAIAVFRASFEAIWARPGNQSAR